MQQDLIGLIVIYLDKYEVLDLLIEIPEWDVYLEMIRNHILMHDEEEREYKECNCDLIHSPMMGQMIRIIESSRYALLEFYQQLFSFRKFDEFIFSWVILFGEESFVEYYWEQKKRDTSGLFRFYGNSTHLVYGLELISLKMRNRFPIHDFYSVLNVIDKYSFRNQDLQFLYQNYHRIERKRPLPMRLFYDIQEKYREWILLNPSFLFIYMEKQDEIEEDSS